VLDIGILSDSIGIVCDTSGQCAGAPLPGQPESGRQENERELMAAIEHLEMYADRIERARAEMEKSGIDYLFVGPSSDLFYLTGYDAHLSERLNLLIIGRNGQNAIVVPVLESPLYAGRESLAPTLIWTETEQPAQKAAEFIGEATGKTIGVADQLWSVFLLRLQEALPGANWTTGNDVMRTLRMRKDAAEIEALAEVARRTDAAWTEFIETAQIGGLTETQAAKKLGALMEKQGLDWKGGICASGPNSASPHHHTGDRVIERGDAVVFDWGSTYKGYHSDITRTVFIGEPTEEFRKVYDIVRRANQAAFEAAKPGAECQSVDKAARDLITAEGYGDAFIHRTGHGLGLDVHEEPYMVSGNTLPLEEGMVFSDEPGIYLEGNFGIRIEDIVYCTEDGARRFNEATRDLTVMD
jgi:Xaa-Pro aminopeptidase